MTISFFNRKILLIIGGISIAVTAVVATEVYDYVYFEVPIKNAVPSEGYAHVDLVPVAQTVHPYTIEDITHDPISDAITVTFKGGTHPVTRERVVFEYVETYSVNESFAFRCDESEGGSYLVFYGYLGVERKNGTDYMRLLHYDGTTHGLMPCIYPDVIIHSRGSIPPTEP